MSGEEGERTLNLTLNVWRQKNRQAEGAFVTYQAVGISSDMSFLEMLDVVNEGLIARGEEPIAFDHDCREGICGQCGVVINGSPHGPRRATTSCQLHMRSFQDGDVLTIEPWRAASFPVIKDLMVDRSAFDRIIASGGFVSVRTGNAPDANDVPVPKDGRRPGDGRRRLHRLWCLRGRLSQRLGHALRRRQGLAPESPAARPARAVSPRPGHGRPDGRRGLRRLLQPRGMRGRLPQGNRGALHLDAEPRLPPRQPFLACRPAPGAARARKNVPASPSLRAARQVRLVRTASELSPDCRLGRELLRSKGRDAVVVDQPAVPPPWFRVSLADEDDPSDESPYRPARGGSSRMSQTLESFAATTCWTSVELPRPLEPRPEISHVLFDFDGTLSLIRQGWPEVMVPMFVEALPRRPGETEDDAAARWSSTTSCGSTASRRSTR